MYFVIKVQKLREDRRKNNLSNCSPSCSKKLEDGKLNCDCGDDVNIFEWSWKNESNSMNTLLSNSNREIVFHPVYSSGTAAVRGDAPFKQNLHYYWEIKMLSNLYGTDVMVGVGTERITLTNCKFRFCSMLGQDDQSWGYSYHGSIQHNTLTRKYGYKFGLGCLIGVHLDMCSGKLEYYLNRKPLGVAFDELKNKELYPMLSSTAAQSAMKLNCAVSAEPTLQMLCLNTITRYRQLYNKYRSIPGLTRNYDRKYFWIGPRDDGPVRKRKTSSDEDLNIFKTKKRASKIRRKCKRQKKITKSRSKQHLRAKVSKSISTTESGPPEDRASTAGSAADVSAENAQDTEPSGSKDYKNGDDDETSEELSKFMYDCLSDTDSDISASEGESMCNKCKFRVQIENDSWSDSTCSNCEGFL